MKALLDLLSRATLEIHEQISTMHEPRSIVAISMPIKNSEIPGVGPKFWKIKLEVELGEIIRSAQEYQKLIDSGVDPAKLDELAEVARALRTLKKVLV